MLVDFSGKDASALNLRVLNGGGERHMYNSLNSLKGIYIGDYIWDYYRDD